jgi:hypothetical protein
LNQFSIIFDAMYGFYQKSIVIFVNLPC